MVIITTRKLWRQQISTSTKIKLAILAVLVGAIIVGYAASNKGVITTRARINHLESIIKCPTCISVSTRDANTASAFALRSFITEMVHHGASDSQIISQLTAIYGQSILLVPPNSGGGVFLVVGGFVGSTLLPIMGVVYYRSKRGNGSALGDRNFGEDAFDSANHKFSSSSSSTQKDLFNGEDGDPSVEVPMMPGHNKVGRSSILTTWLRLSIIQRVVGVTASLMIMSGLFVLSYGLFVQRSSSSTAPSLSVAVTIRNAQALASTGNDVAALEQFGSVLARNPNEPVALAWNGWLLRQAGDKAKSPSLVNAGLKQMNESVKLNPRYFYSRLFLGISLFRDKKDLSGAVRQFNAYFALTPPKNLTAQVKAIINDAYAANRTSLPSNANQG